MSRKLQYFYATALSLGAVYSICAAGSAQAQAQSQTPPPAQTPAAGAGELSEVIVTAQRRDEAIQSVPIAVTALTGAGLERRRIENGADLELAVPNMTFSRGFFGAVDYQIRGIGYQVISTAADTGVGVAENDAPLIVNRLADADLYDVNRVETLRGPQGTLFGRNATGGVINTITNKPTDVAEGEITGELGNYDQRKLSGFINVPIAKGLLDFRLAGMGLKRDGDQYNAELNDHIDGRDLYSYRASLAFTPTSRFRANLMWEHYQEDDNRFGMKYVCAKDPGPTSVGGVAVMNAQAQGLLSRGCLPTTSYSQAAQTGTVNTIGTLTGALANTFGLINGDANAGATQPADPRTVDEAINPSYKALNDLYELNVEWDVTNALKLSSLTAFSQDRLRTHAAFEDGTVPFNVGPVTPNGVVNDAQIGSSKFLELDQDDYRYKATQLSQELRLQSSFTGPINFSLGGLYLSAKRFEDLFIESNGTTAEVQFEDLLGSNAYVDPNAVANGQGHNYFLGQTPYQLTSGAVFGEVYWQATNPLRVTVGARYTDDHKDVIDDPVELLAPGSGFPASAITEQKVDFREPTGRINVDWRPRLDFTDQTLVYASYSRGYKSGGFNGANIVSVPAVYSPEFVNAYEIGTKNTLLNHKLILNLTGFYYDYSNYQISQVQGLNAYTSNVNATIMGLEFESQWQATHALSFDANIGLLNARIDGGSSIDTFNRTQNNPSLTYLKSLTSGCVGQTADVAALIQLINAGTVPASTLSNLCPTAAAPNGPYASSNSAQNPLAAFGVTVPTFAGDPVNLKGKDLPNAPHETVALGMQYRVSLPDDWRAVFYGQYYYQGAAYADIYNDPANRLKGWSNINMTLTFEKPSQALKVQFYVKNLLDAAPVTTVGLDSETLGQSRATWILDPRRFGLSVSKRF
jgi:outer membrane receptor protein involved in Fe transport